MASLWKTAEKKAVRKAQSIYYVWTRDCVELVVRHFEHKIHVALNNGELLFYHRRTSANANFLKFDKKIMKNNCIVHVQLCIKIVAKIG